MSGMFAALTTTDAVADVMAGLGVFGDRGHDSVGVAAFDEEGLAVRHTVGRLDDLRALLEIAPLQSTAAIGHARWAARHTSALRNCHPHRAGRVALVHEGHIENHRALRAEMAATGRVFRTDTDSEVLAHRVDDALSAGLHPIDALQEACARLRGTYALALLVEGAQDALFVARNGMPLWVGIAADGVFVASDPSALTPFALEVFPLEDGDHGEIGRDRIHLFDADGVPVHRVARPVRRPAPSRPVALVPGFEGLASVHRRTGIVLATDRLPRPVHATVRRSDPSHDGAHLRLTRHVRHPAAMSLALE